MILQQRQMTGNNAPFHISKLSISTASIERNRVCPAATRTTNNYCSHKSSTFAPYGPVSRVTHTIPKSYIAIVIDCLQFTLLLLTPSPPSCPQSAAKHAITDTNAQVPASHVKLSIVLSKPVETSRFRQII